MSHESDLYQELNAAMFGGSSGGDEIPAGDVLNQVALPLVLVLSLAVVIAGQNSRAIAATDAIIRRWDKSEQKRPLILEAVKQKLLRNIDAVCQVHEAELRLAQFPSVDRIRMQGGFPADDDLQAMCGKAETLFHDVPNLGLQLYAQALSYVGPGDLPSERIYDLFTFPESAGADAAGPFVITGDDKGQELSAWARKRVNERCLRWYEQVRTLQLHLVDHALSDPAALNELIEGDRLEMKQRIRDTFKRRGYSLLNDTF